MGHQTQEGSEMVKRYYHNLIRRITDYNNNDLKEFISTKQGDAPDGYICVAVLGFHDKKEVI